MLSSLAAPTAGAQIARWAVSTVFFINGAIFASWVVNIPFVRERLHLSDSALGLVLLAIAAGAVLTLVMGGRLIAQFGSRNVTQVAALCYIFLLPLLLWASNIPTLVLLLIAFGACNGAMDVAMNAHGVVIEERLGRPIMSSLHALYSAGGLTGAGAGAVLLGAGVLPQMHVLGASVVLLALAAVALPRLLPTSIDKGSSEGSSAPLFVIPRGALAGIALLIFLCFVGEGAMADWSAVYLRDVLNAEPGFSAAGFTAFSLAMAIGRFTGDTLRSHIPAVFLLRVCGAIAAAGLGVALLIGNPVAALIGFICVGLGLANVVPILFSAAGATRGIETGMAIASVASVGYLGFLAGPPLIGLIADAITLPLALLLVVVFMGMIAALAGIVAPTRSTGSR